MTGDRGYTQFPNHLLEALMTADLSASELKIALVIVRKTYGFHKEKEIISLTTLCDAIDRSLSVVARSVKNLIGQRIVLEVSKPEFLNGRTLALNEAVDEWETKNERLVENGRGRLVENGRERLVKNDKSTLLKENYKYNYKKYKSQPKNYEEQPSYDKELFERMINSDDY